MKSQFAKASTLHPDTVHDAVRAYYGRTLSDSNDLHSNAAHCQTVPPPKYVRDVLPLIADEVVSRFYGCGSPIPPALEGCTVLDLGCGTGRDVYVLSKLVGPRGRVIGVDMTPEQLEIAQRYREYHAQKFGYDHSNVEFRAGYIEDLAACGIEDASVDLVVSNCVVNLSPFKDLVFSEVSRVLKPGGELYFSDVYASRRLPEELRNDPILRSECLGGATYEPDFRALMDGAGLGHYVWTVDDPLHIGDLSIETRVGFTAFRSRTVRAIKCPQGVLEATEEDYGQHAVYLGGMSETPRYFDWDRETRFVKGKPCAISGNVAALLQASRYGHYFQISPKRAHRGAFHAARAQEALDVRCGKKAVGLKMLEDAYERAGYPTFFERLGAPELLQTSAHAHTLQVNITYACNLACRHCYLGCGPSRTERMPRETMEACLRAFDAGGFQTFDITGGSPELHPDFEWFLRQAASRAGWGNVIVRTNLTLLTLPECAHLVDVFAELGVHVVASLPFFDDAGTASQRGKHVFEKAIAAIRALNARGYGAASPAEASLVLDLVYNVAGPFLPLPQEMIEASYHKALERDQGVRFNGLFAFNNWACGRFAADLLDYGMFDDYLALLADNFNTMAATKLMCLDMVNVDWDGRLYDCEPNHVLGLPIQLDDGAGSTRDATIDDLLSGPLPPRQVRTNPLCYSCTAGFGSSCGGALV
ncbi:Fe-S oxidoreductase [Denitrobacterium detoxificans]|uniref:Radical SAM/Cys-rich domain-containing protein n=1 Tax=Denitrobacterium detoxificans TaxID=79604 RepID=A0A172S030_9ACTN|nr:arsenosugar biosynthesis radical SAM (seleno)protein ArsS [Denitrobacterium detoxificans]ANE23316.1 Fe-S oxidoreductase [Denitrobacterium detoxificans]SEO40029.1 radical SAM/Cys-rich domain-containing protein [Denitrobacterium detoxificans]